MIIITVAFNIYFFIIILIFILFILQNTSEGCSPNVKKDRRKFGLLKKRSNKGSSIDLASSSPNDHVAPSTVSTILITFGISQLTCRLVSLLVIFHIYRMQQHCPLQYNQTYFPVVKHVCLLIFLLRAP